MASTKNHIDQLAGQIVVLDASSQYVYIGTLIGADEYFLTLDDADVHDMRDSTTTRERYIHDSKVDGIRINRKQVLVKHSEVVSISTLEDVLP